MAMVEGLCSSHKSDTQGDQMESLLASWNLQRVTIPGDGNCLFTSVAFSLVQRIQGGDTVTRDRLLTLGVPEAHIKDVSYIGKLLRVRMVDEWNANHDYYQGFVTSDITTLADDYLQSGCFSGNVGDLMVLTISNVLLMPITIFTSIPNMPVLCIMPTTEITGTVQPILLAYTQSGPGHYDCAVPVSNEQTQTSHAPKTANKVYMWEEAHKHRSSMFIIEVCMCKEQQRVHNPMYMQRMQQYIWSSTTTFQQ